MIKYIIVDVRVMEEYLKIIAGFLQLRNFHDSRLLLPSVLNKADDYRNDSGVWDVLTTIMAEDQYNSLDFETVMYVVENTTEMIYESLNKRFNLPQGTLYSFEDWIGQDLRLEIHND